MVTATKDTHISWDAFLGKADRLAVEGFRESEWPNIKRKLGQAPYNIRLAEGLEPHWIRSGKAVYWQPVILRKRMEETGEDGRMYRSIKEVHEGWQPTLGGLPANNASQIAHYLGKGFRLRPPQDGVDVETLEAAVPSEALQAEPPAPVGKEYFCYRHGWGQKVFKNWKAYRNHCLYYDEVIEEEVPSEIMERMGRFKYYCVLHDKGFDSIKLAGTHYTIETRRPGKLYHPTVDEMHVRGEADADQKSTTKRNTKTKIASDGKT
jgi:hypothetical protein